MNGMCMTRFMIILATMAATAVATPVKASGDAELAIALDAAADHQHGLALVHFRRSGEQGNVQAQRSAGLMLLNGEELYGDEIKANRAEALRWLSLAAENGCGVSKLILTRIGKRTPGSQSDLKAQHGDKS